MAHPIMHETYGNMVEYTAHIKLDSDMRAPFLLCKIPEKNKANLYFDLTMFKAIYILTDDIDQKYMIINNKYSKVIDNVYTFNDLYKKYNFNNSCENDENNSDNTRAKSYNSSIMSDDISELQKKEIPYEKISEYTKKRQYVLDTTLCEIALAFLEDNDKWKCLNFILQIMDYIQFYKYYGKNKKSAMLKYRKISDEIYDKILKKLKLINEIKSIKIEQLKEHNKYLLLKNELDTLRKNQNKQQSPPKCPSYREFLKGISKYVNIVDPKKEEKNNNKKNKGKK
jgi:hypothetical protein